MALSRSLPPDDEKDAKVTTTRLTPVLFLQLTGLLMFLTMVSAADLALRGLHRYPQPPVWSVPGGEPARGRAAIQRHGCGGCHIIPGIRDATGQVGPDLSQLARKMYIAGVAPNTPNNLVAWIQNPQAIDPQTAMPNLGLTESEARHIAAFLLAD